MNTVLFVVCALVALAVASSVAIWGVVLQLPSFEVSVPVLSSFAAGFAVLLPYMGFVHAEVMKLIQHQALTRRQADRVARVAFGIRDRTIGGLVYTLLAALTISGSAVAVHLDPLNTRIAAAAAGGSALISLALLPWLIGKHREIGRFQHRLEQSKRDEEGRRKQLEVLRAAQKAAGPQTAL